MSKKDFIALADAIRHHNDYFPDQQFTGDQLNALKRFCQRQNGNFNSVRWLGYIKGECGPSGGRIK